MSFSGPMAWLLWSKGVIQMDRCIVAFRFPTCALNQACMFTLWLAIGAKPTIPTQPRTTVDRIHEGIFHDLFAFEERQGGQ